MDDATRALFAAVRALSPAGFEELTRMLPAHWDTALRLEGINPDQAGFGVLLKARWQNFPREMRRRFAADLGAAAQRLAGEPDAEPRIVQVAGAARASERGRGAVGQDPKELAKLLRAAAKTAGEAARAVGKAVGDQAEVPEQALETLRAYNEALGTARSALGERGLGQAAAAGQDLAAMLDDLASGGDRELLRIEVTRFARVDGSGLPLLEEARGQAAALLEVEPAKWSAKQERLARGLAALAELHRLATGGADPAGVLDVSGRAQAELPSDLQGLTILAASGGLDLPEAEARPAPSKRRGRRRSGGRAVA